MRISDGSSDVCSSDLEILGYSPDVIVLVYGHYETIHLVLPHWLERHANSLKARPRWWSGLYRRRILRPLWMLFAHLQATLDKVVPPTIRHRERADRKSTRLNSSH